jgi:hypothetical protein
MPSIEQIIQSALQGTGGGRQGVPDLQPSQLQQMLAGQFGSQVRVPGAQMQPANPDIAQSSPSTVVEAAADQKAAQQVGGGMDPALLQQLLMNQGALAQQQHGGVWDPSGAGAAAGIYDPVGFGMAPGASLPYGFPTLPFIGMPTGAGGPAQYTNSNSDPNVGSDQFRQGSNMTPASAQDVMNSLMSGRGAISQEEADILAAQLGVGSSTAGSGYANPDGTDQQLK